MPDIENETKDVPGHVAEPASELPPAQLAGAHVIAAHLKTLSTQPGVYRMLNGAGEVIYVGKARNLKARVSSYARLAGHATRIQRMIASTAAMEFVTVHTEAEALLLEANLIKRFKPRFNVLMRDDKSFPYILIRRDTAAPQVMKHRGARTTKGEYFGPFASTGAVNRTINMLQRGFLLRSCSDAVFDSRTRPCLLHQIKRCSAPCTREIEPEDYDNLVDEAVSFLRGGSQNMRELLQGMMEKASDALEFEEAAKFRNRLWALAHVTAGQGINPEGVEEADVFAAYQEGGQTCIQVFFFRTGQNWGNRAYYPKADKSVGVEEVLESFMAQFYDDKPVPRLVLLSHAIAEAGLMAEALSIKAQRKIEIRVPQRGTKSGLVDHALSNAREALGRKLAESSSQLKLLQALGERFQLAGIPARVEVYDNSHIAGTHAVGCMIVAGPEGFIKNAYRKFNIKADGLTPGDDYAMMRQVLMRRFKRLAESGAFAAEPIEGETVDSGVIEGGAGKPVNFSARPDLVLIDGGAGQVAVACEVMAELGLADIAIVGVAKGPDRDAGREHFHVPKSPAPFMLEPRDPVLYFVQRLRDEAHRFAIGTHRAKRSKAISANPLDDIGGIGPKRRRALMKHFGSAKSVSKAGIEDLKAVGGVSAEMAQKIYDFFNDQK